MAKIPDNREWFDGPVSPGAKSDIAKADNPQTVHATVTVTVSIATTDVSELVNDECGLSNAQCFRVILGFLIGTVIECEISPTPSAL